MKKSSAWKMVAIVFVFCAALAIFLTQTAPAQTLTTLYAFSLTSDGAYPYAGLVQGTDGNFYGTTADGGDYYYCNQSPYICGMVFKITPAGTLTVLHSFYVTDGASPYAGLVQGTDGNFYGTTSEGGGGNCPLFGCGTVFQITPAGTLTMLHRFDVTDGANPYAGLVQATDGNFYGTTLSGGDLTCDAPYGCGTVFKITAGGTLTTLHSLNGTDGNYPYAGLVQATDGNFYGTTLEGGDLTCDAPYGCGTVFKITAGGTLTTLHSFNGTDGYKPAAGLVQATDGNFYGTTKYAGDLTCNAPYGCGTVFKITAGGTLTTLHSFEGTDGAVPYATLVQATDGNFYGTTEYGGTSGNCGADRCGTIFKITPAGTLTMLHSFDDTDGSAPYGALIQATDGNFYGTTEGGNSGGHYDVYGTVFSLTGPGPQLIPTTTVLMTAPNPSNLGQPVTMTATVTAQDGSIPTGTVVFESNGVQIGSASLNGSGVAVLVYAGLSAGTDSLTAVYQGSGTLAGSTSNTVPQVVQPAISTIAVTSSPNPSTFGEPVTLTATVSPAGPPAPTGTVSFNSNATAISGCTAVPLTSSLTAVCTTSTLAVGTDAIVATYSGDTNYSGSSGGLSQLVNPTPSPLQFVAVTPCRLVDTRPDRGGSGPIPGGTFQSFPIPQEGGCNIPTSAAAYSLNVSVVPQGQLGYLTIWPTGQGQPLVATLNSLDGRIKADAAIVPAGDQGAISIYVTNTTNVILDINGYFAPASGSTLAFYPLPPCRVADTRHSTYPPGLGPPYLTGHAERQFPILNATSCNIPPSAEAYSLNFSVVPHGGLGYLTVWPTGQSQPLVSTLNDLVAQIIANAAIVPAGTSGDVSVYPSSDTDVIIDINGYFAPPGMGGLSLYPAAPCRVIDTRKIGSGQPFSGNLTPPVDVADSACQPPAAAQAYVFNATVVPTGALGYLTLWPDGQPKPLVSTLNALDGSITNNMAIMPSTNGKVDAFASGITQLILDISSYFAP